MRKYILNSITIILLTIIVFSCDFVQNANPAIEPSASTTTGGSSVIYRNVLVEDYTGHKCGYCPPAADTLKYLENKYPGKIIPLAVHAGFYALVNATYPTDFRTATGTAYDSQFGNSASGNPNGLINRVGFGTGGFIKAYTQWESEVTQMISQAAKFQIKIKNTFNTGSNSLNTDITVKSLTNNTGSYKLVVLLTEDSIVAEQLDYRLPIGNQTKTNYVFNHVLRGAINSTWGDAIFATTSNLNDSVVKSYTNFTINAGYNASKCHVVAYIYDADNSGSNLTAYEVLQAEEEKVK